MRESRRRPPLESGRADDKNAALPNLYLGSLCWTKHIHPRENPPQALPKAEVLLTDIPMRKASDNAAQCNRFPRLAKGCMEICHSPCQVPVEAASTRMVMLTAESSESQHPQASLRRVIDLKNSRKGFGLKSSGTHLSGLACVSTPRICSSCLSEGICGFSMWRMCENVLLCSVTNGRGHFWDSYTFKSCSLTVLKARINSHIVALRA